MPALKSRIGRSTRRIGTGLRKEAPKVVAGAAVVERVAPAFGARGRAVGKVAGVVKRGATVAAGVGKAEQKIRQVRRAVTRKRR